VTGAHLHFICSPACPNRHRVRVGGRAACTHLLAQQGAGQPFAASSQPAVHPPVYFCHRQGAPRNKVIARRRFPTTKQSHVVSSISPQGTSSPQGKRSPSPQPFTTKTRSHKENNLEHDASLCPGALVGTAFLVSPPGVIAPRSRVIASEAWQSPLSGSKASSSPASPGIPSPVSSGKRSQPLFIVRSFTTKTRSHKENNHENDGYLCPGALAVNAFSSNIILNNEKIIPSLSGKIGTCES